MMGSRNIAEVTGKKPAHVVRDIESMLESLGKHYPELDDYDSAEFSIKRKMYNGRLVIDEVWLNETLSMTLVTGYDACRRLALVKQWQDMKQELSRPRIAVQPPQPAPATNHDILSLVRVVAEATASATMKAVMEMSGANLIAAAPASPAGQPAPIGSGAGFVNTDSEFEPVHKVSWETGLSDPSCRRLIQFANLPSRQLPGVRGLCVHRESFLHAFQVLLEESVRPSGKRKRWQHPEFGGFVLRKDTKETLTEVEA
ncbi:DNA-binding protein [Salmonella enterica]|nr:DNA-binding protein [Salmonella enterica]EEM9538970.1 DNA-binding protein [Salmonella enterica]EEN0873284.1 DNA-binding protein [Salmonella enterica]EEN1610340.1 DNA-binding protein [Salmonella enterica]EFQ3471476.1 DNA-binding protein [Salmonella enterica]